MNNPQLFDGARIGGEGMKEILIDTNISVRQDILKESLAVARSDEGHRPETVGNEGFRLLNYLFF